MNDALTGLAIAALIAVTGLIPYLGGAAKAALVAYTEGKHNAALDRGAETIAIAHAGASVAAQANLLARRFPDAMAVLSPPQSVLEDKLQKAARTVAGRRV